MPFKDTADRMMTLGDTVRPRRRPRAAADRAQEPVRRRPAPAARTAEVLQSYARPGRGDVVRSGAWSRRCARSRPACRAGIVAERHYAHQEWQELTAAKRRSSPICCMRSARGRISSPIRCKDLPSPGPLHCAPRVRPAAADLDGANERRPRPAPDARRTR